MSHFEGVLTSRSYAHHFGPGKTAPHYVYRIFDVDGDLIYIGCTSNVKRRIASHRSASGRQVASQWISLFYDRHEVEGPFDGRDAGRTAEAAAIESESPIFNSDHRRATISGARGGAAHYLVERGHVRLACDTACTCWAETLACLKCDAWCPAHMAAGATPLEKPPTDERWYSFYDYDGPLTVRERADAARAALNAAVFQESAA